MPITQPDESHHLAKSVTDHGWVTSFNHSKPILAQLLKISNEKYLAEINFTQKYQCRDMQVNLVIMYKPGSNCDR